MRLLLGGSPCTHWSIAQSRNRETKPEGLGWELFRNYLIAKERYRPDYFLYENNKSISAAIREQITAELGGSPDSYQFRAGVRAEPPAALLDEHSWHRAAGGSRPGAAGYSGQRLTAPGKGLRSQS